MSTFTACCKVGAISLDSIEAGVKVEKREVPSPFSEEDVNEVDLKVPNGFSPSAKLLVNVKGDAVAEKGET